MERQRRVPPRLRARAARRHALRVLRAAQPLRARGLTLAETAAELERMDLFTFSGRCWSPGRLSQVLAAGRVALMHEQPRARAPVFRGHDHDDRAAIDTALAAT